MKIKVTRIISTTLIFAVCLAATQPYLAFADDHGKGGEKGKGVKMSSVNFCAQITTMQTQTISLFDKNTSKIKPLKEGNLLHAKNATKKDFTEYVSRLKQKYTQPAQISAIDAFKVEVDKAISDRKVAVDSLMTTVKVELDKLVQNKNVDNSATIASAKATLQKAFETAKTSCANGVDPKTVKKTLKEAIQTVHTTAKKGQKNINLQANPQVKDLITKKKTELQTIEKSFRTRIDTAKTNLNNALGIK